MWNPQTHGATGSWDGADDRNTAGRLAPGKHTRTQDMVQRKQPPTGGGGHSAGGVIPHDDPYALHLGGIDFLGIELSGNSRREDFSALEAKLGAGKVAQFRAAAGHGPDALLLLFTAGGVVVDQHNRAAALAIADAYIRYVEIEGVAHHTGALGKSHHDGDPVDKKGHAQTGAPGSLEELALRIGNWSLEASLGHYVDVEMNGHIPTEIPGLTIDLGGKLGFTVLADGTRELEVEVSKGISFEAFGLFKANEKRLLSMKLSAKDGASLGDAFVDALKQSVRAVLVDTGIEEQLLLLREMAIHGSTRQDWLRTLWAGLRNPVKGGVEAAERLIADGFGPQVIQLVDAYQRFFADDTRTGFDLSIHQQSTREIGGGHGPSTGVTFDVGVGASEGIGDDKAHLYAEASGSATFSAGKLGPSMTYRGKVKLDHDGPHFTIGFDLEVPWNGTDLFVAASALAMLPGFRKMFGTLTGKGPTDQSGWEAALDLFGEALRELVVSTFSVAIGMEHTMALSVDYTFDLDGLESVTATAKTKTEADLIPEEVKEFDEKVSFGTILDVTAAYREAAAAGLHHGEK